MKIIVVCFTIAFVVTIAAIGMSVDNIDARIEGALDALGMFLRAVGIIIVVALILFTLIAIYALWTKFRIKSRRPVDGAFSLQYFRLRKWRSELPWPVATLYFLMGEMHIVNPNTMMSSAGTIDPFTGLLEQTPAAGWDRQLELRVAVERTNAIRAAFPGDDARSNRYGAMSDSPRLHAPMWKQLTSSQPRAALPAPNDGDAIDAEFQVMPVRYADAIATNGPTSFAVGQDIKTGEIVRWNVDQHPHARFHGTSQGSGKTTLSKGIAIGMLAQGAHVVVLDRRRFKNFGELSGYAEFIPTNDPRQFAQAMQSLCTIYQERDRLLGESGAADISQLHNPPPRYCVLIAEFGALCTAAQAEGGDVLEGALQPLSLIMREAAATGIHLLFEDQVVDRGAWPRSVSANASAVFTGYLPANMGQAGGYYHAHQLGKYEFHYDGHTLRGWDIQKEAQGVLRGLPRRLRGDLMVGEIVHADRSQTVHANVREPVRLEVEGERANATNDYKWLSFTQDWLRNNPDGGPSALARAMWAAEGHIKPHTNYKGEAAKMLDMCRASHSRGPATALDQIAALGVDLRDIRLRSGDKLGFDPTHGG